MFRPYLNDREDAHDVFERERLGLSQVVGAAGHSQPQPLAHSPQERQLVGAVAVLVVAATLHEDSSDATGGGKEGQRCQAKGKTCTAVKGL